MKKLNHNIAIYFMTFGTLFLASCEPNEDNPNQQEIITTVRIVATPQLSGTPVSFEFNDPDGTGGNAPVIDTIFLAANTTYNVSLELYNEAITPVDTITNEIEEEGTDHQFFFVPTGITINTAYEDQDANGNPIGLLSAWSAGNAASGTLRLTLKHLGGIPKDGNITTGETDIQIDFPAVIQ
jgi:hypothetical protein